jgi:hypothetical protein
VRRNTVNAGELRQSAEVRHDDVPKLLCEFLCFCGKLLLECARLFAVREFDASFFALNRAS